MLTIREPSGVIARSTAPLRSCVARSVKVGSFPPVAVRAWIVAPAATNSSSGRAGLLVISEADKGETPTWTPWSTRSMAPMPAPPHPWLNHSVPAVMASRAGQEPSPVSIVSTASVSVSTMLMASDPKPATKRVPSSSANARSAPLTPSITPVGLPARLVTTTFS